jgi:hypothetical protein
LLLKLRLRLCSSLETKKTNPKKNKNDNVLKMYYYVIIIWSLNKFCKIVHFFRGASGILLFWLNFFVSLATERSPTSLRYHFSVSFQRLHLNKVTFLLDLFILTLSLSVFSRIFSNFSYQI